MSVRDLIEKKDLGVFEGKFVSEVVPHGVVMIKIYHWYQNMNNKIINFLFTMGATCCV